MTLIPENEDFALLIRETGVLAIKAKVFARVTIKSNTRKHFFILTRYETRISTVVSTRPPGWPLQPRLRHLSCQCLSSPPSETVLKWSHFNQNQPPSPSLVQIEDSEA